MDFARSTPRDTSGIFALESEIFPDPWSERDITVTITQMGAMCYTAREGDRVIAYILGRVIAPEGEIYRIAVAPDKRQRGIAYRLLDYAVKTERGKGLERLFLEVRSNNAPARALYRAYGFVEMGIRKNYYKNPQDDAIVMLHANRADLCD